MACIMDLIDGALRCKKTDGRFSYVGPTYTQTKATIWMYLKRFTAGIPGIEQRESDLMVILPNGAQVRLFGADNFERLRGSYSDALVVDEYADIDPRAWPEVLRPSLADRVAVQRCSSAHQKDVMTFTGYPRAAAQNDPDWFSLVLKASETHLLPQSELLDDIRGMLTPEAYAAEMECSFDAAILGAYFAKELDDAQAAGRITRALYDPALPVHTAWDLGIGDSYRHLVFPGLPRRGARDRLLRGVGLRPTALTPLCWPPGASTYGTDYLPHDAQARQLGTGRSPWETLHGLTNRIPRGAAAAEPDGRYQRGARHDRLVLV